jgi:hypothetical protein
LQRQWSVGAVDSFKENEKEDSGFFSEKKNGKDPAIFLPFFVIDIGPTFDAGLC